MLDKVIAVAAKAGNIGKVCAMKAMEHSDGIKKVTTLLVSGLSLTTAVKKCKDAFGKKEQPVKEQEPQGKGLPEQDSEEVLAII